LRFACKMTLVEVAMLGSNQRPLLCKGATMLYWVVPEFAK
jgi:hypothetical protein